MNSVLVTAALLLQEAPPEGLVLALALWYALGFLGMLLAWNAYRKRRPGGHGGQPTSAEKEKREP
jgi:hypothetical protein